MNTYLHIYTHTHIVRWKGIAIIECGAAAAASVAEQMEAYLRLRLMNLKVRNMKRNQMLLPYPYPLPSVPLLSNHITQNKLNEKPNSKALQMTLELENYVLTKKNQKGKASNKVG